MHKIVTGDCLEKLARVPRPARLVYADPPFNIGRAYPTYDDCKTSWAYLDWLADRLKPCWENLTPDGSLWLQMAPRHQADVCYLLRNTVGMTLLQTVIWHYTFGPAQRRKFTPSYQCLNWFVKDPKDYVFRDQAIRVPSARQLKYNDSRANPAGKVPDDVWTVSRVAGTFGERAERVNGVTVCQTPEAVVERVIRACTDPGDLILDPFSGTGTVPAVAKRLSRDCLAVEICPATARIARERVKAVPAGTVSGV